MTWVLALPVWAETPTIPVATASGIQAIETASPPVIPSDPSAHAADAALSTSPALGPSLQPPQASSSAPVPKTSAWHALSKRQKQALAPLADKWHELTGQQRQKWIALSKSFLQLTDEEQMTLHSRMREWVALSPRQRSQERFHYNTLQSLSAQDKRAQWEAYQALSEREKNKLSSGPKPPVKSAARSFAPPNSRLVSPPRCCLPTHQGRYSGLRPPSRSTPRPCCLNPLDTDPTGSVRRLRHNHSSALSTLGFRSQSARPEVIGASNQRHFIFGFPCLPRPRACPTPQRPRLL
uniref:DUF3106 domain-containing protein n=1 Tax=Limnohabitans sp. TaxID=1907725 RepID=UPI004048260C